MTPEQKAAAAAESIERLHARRSRCVQNSMAAAMQSNENISSQAIAGNNKALDDALESLRKDHCMAALQSRS